MKKKYSTPEEEKQIANDAAIPYSSTSSSQSQENKTSSRPPCQYTLEELTDNIERAIRDFEMGKGTPHEQIKRKTL